MILGFVSSGESDSRGVLYDHIPQPKRHEIQIGPRTRPHIVVVSTTQQLRSSVTEQTHGIIYLGRGRENVIFSCENKEENIKHARSLPILHGSRIRLPHGHKYSGRVSISQRNQIWGDTQIVTDSEGSYLMPRFIHPAPVVTLLSPRDFDFTDIVSSIEARRRFLVSLGMPGQILVQNNGDIVVNPK